jgi:hypothetical protein
MPGGLYQNMMPRLLPPYMRAEPHDGRRGRRRAARRERRAGARRAHAVDRLRRRSDAVARWSRAPRRRSPHRVRTVRAPGPRGATRDPDLSDREHALEAHSALAMAADPRRARNAPRRAPQPSALLRLVARDPADADRAPVERGVTLGDLAHARSRWDLPRAARARKQLELGWSPVEEDALLANHLCRHARLHHADVGRRPELERRIDLGWPLHLGSDRRHRRAHHRSEERALDAVGRQSSPPTRHRSIQQQRSLSTRRAGQTSQTASGAFRSTT